MNDFYHRQHEPFMLRLLAARRRVCNEIRTMLLTGLVVGVLIPSAFSLAFMLTRLHLGYTPERVRVLMTLCGMTSFIIVAFLMSDIQQEKRKAALIQEEYDTRLFRLPWHVGATGQPLSPAQLVRHTRPDRRLATTQGDRAGPLHRALNVPPALLVLLCQSRSLGRDALRRKRATWLLGIISGLDCLLSALPGASIPNVPADYLTVIALLLPICMYYGHYASGNKRADRQEAILRNEIKQGLSRAIRTQAYDGQELEILARRVQDGVFQCRLHGNPAPGCLVRDDEAQANRLFERMAGMLEELIASREKSVPAAD